MGGLSFADWLDYNQDDLVFKIQQHALLSLYVILIASALGLLIGILSYRRPWTASLSISTAAVIFTIPSVAMFGMVLSIATGGGLLVIIPVLVVYALLPVVRNTIIGLQGVDANMLDAARGMGVARFRMLWQIRLPSAWPVILAGVRVSAQLTIGLVVIAAYVDSSLGLGSYAFSSLNNLGSVNTDNEAIASVVFTAAIALLFDAAFVLVRRLTTPKGLRV